MAIPNTVAQFGRYRLRLRLATASVCEVWLAEIDGCAAESRTLVLKKLRSELLQHAEMVEAFTQRARRAMTLDHPCIARVLDVVVERTGCAFAMEYVDGKSLRQLVSAVGGVGNALPVWFAIHVTRRICQALEHAHDAVDAEGRANRVIHENLCPENVFLTFDGHVKVADFGLSQLALLPGHLPLSKEAAHMPLDTGWNEPRTETKGSAKQDLLGIGRVLYELLTGICPECAEGDGAAYLPPSHFAPWINVEVDHLVSRILSPTDTQLFGSAREIRRALDEYLSARRHEVNATHISGLVSVLFSPECHDSAPPTMRLHEAAAELAMRRSRRTTPPDFDSVEQPTYNPVAQPSLSSPPNSQQSHQTIPVPCANAPAEVSSMEASLHSPSRPEERTPERSIDVGEKGEVNESRQGPFRHDWDLALKRAREEAQTTQRASGEHPVAAPVRQAPPIDPMEQAVQEFERGLEHMRRGELERALAAWERALELDPQHRVCRANLSLLKKKLGSQT